MALITYASQVSFLKPLIRSGKLTEGGTFHGPGTSWGKLWSGRAYGYIINFKTIGDGPWMVAGSFRVRASNKGYTYDR
jgi:hypothetical protein